MKDFISSMSERTKWAITLCVGMALMILVLIACQPQIEVQTMGVTNLDSLHLGDIAATATPILMVDGQSGNEGNLLEVRVAATPVYAILSAGTQDMQGNLSDSGGTFTIADDVLVDGQADTEQMVVQGVSGQGADLIVAESSGGTDVFNVGIGGAITYSVSYADAAQDDTNVIEAYSSQQTDIWRIQDNGGSETYVVVTATGEMSWRSPVISCADLSYQLSVSDTAALVTNQGIADAGHGNGETQVIDLPDAKAGRHFCFVNWTTTDSGPTMAINPQDSDQVAFLTNSNGDCISNTTSGDAICLIAQDDVFWLPTSETGTWADGN